MTNHNNLKSNIIPGMRYRNAPAAIDWLCNVLGFERHLVVPGDNGTIAHAQLTLGNGMIMLGSHHDAPDNIVAPPETNNSPLTQSAYIVVSDIQAHYQRAKTAGAHIVMELEEQHYGGSLYTARDPEGQLWCIGSYNPWAHTTP